MEKKSLNVTEQKMEHGDRKKCECRATPKIRKRVQITFTEPSLTQQSAAAEADINNIVARYQKTGILPEVARQGVFGDVSNIPDYQTALNIVQDAEAAFKALPSPLRARFNHNPGELLEFVANEQNRAEAVALGLIEGDALKRGGTPLETNPPPVSGETVGGSKK